MELFKAWPSKRKWREQHGIHEAHVQAWMLFMRTLRGKRRKPPLRIERAYLKDRFRPPQ